VPGLPKICLVSEVGAFVASRKNRSQYFFDILTAMSRVGTVNPHSPHEFFGTFGGVPFWPGGLTLLPASPGAGKTSLLLRMIFEGAAAGIPSAIACYEHTEDELKFRLYCQAQAMIAGAHNDADDSDTEKQLAKCSAAVLMATDYKEDTVRGIEDALLKMYGFPEKGPALVAVDYLNVIPVVGLTGMVPVEFRSGEAAAALRGVAKKHGWAVIAAAALKSDSFTKDLPGLEDLFGDERVPYEADRIFFIKKEGNPRDCGCVSLTVHALKDRTARVRTWPMDFWGERFYPALEHESVNHDGR
jgi:hypothetical protein